MAARKQPTPPPAAPVVHSILADSHTAPPARRADPRITTRGELAGRRFPKAPAGLYFHRPTHADELLELAVLTLGPTLAAASLVVAFVLR